MSPYSTPRVLARTPPCARSTSSFWKRLPFGAHAALSGRERWRGCPASVCTSKTCGCAAGPEAVEAAREEAARASEAGAGGSAGLPVRLRGEREARETRFSGCDDPKTTLYGYPYPEHTAKRNNGARVLRD